DLSILLWHPFSRSYGVILPSSLTKVLPRVLEFSSRLPVSVYGTGSNILDSSFSWQCGVSCFSTCFSIPIVSRCLWKDGFAYLSHLLTWTRSTIDTLNLSSCVPTSLIRILLVQELSPVVHRLRYLPRLRSRLTLRGRALLRKPWAFDG